MRGAAFTALKEWQSPDAVPFFEDGLSDGSGLVRALAAEGLAKLDAGRRSPKFRQALEDQAVLVKEAVLKDLQNPAIPRSCRWLSRCSRTLRCVCGWRPPRSFAI
ncbi:MAG: HEAT repeat domain-containing protein [Nitrospira sp.]|nr:HEAT repeat domain-containing protein [Nitrospira sp.]